MNAKDKEKLSKIINDDTVRAPVELHFFRHGLPIEHAGFRNFTDCVILYATGYITKFGDIYTVLGEIRDEKSKTIAKPVEHILNRREYIKRALSDIAGMPYKPRLIPIETVPATAKRLTELGILPADLADRCKPFEKDADEITPEQNDCSEHE